jgi:hypothetical protein
MVDGSKIMPRRKHGRKNELTRGRKLLPAYFGFEFWICLANSHLSTKLPEALTFM